MIKDVILNCSENLWFCSKDFIKHLLAPQESTAFLKVNQQMKGKNSKVFGEVSSFSKSSKSLHLFAASYRFYRGSANTKNYPRSSSMFLSVSSTLSILALTSVTVSWTSSWDLTSPSVVWEAHPLMKTIDAITRSTNKTVFLFIYTTRPSTETSSALVCCTS